MDQRNPKRSVMVTTPWPGYPFAVSGAGFCFVSGLMALDQDGAVVSSWEQAGFDPDRLPGEFSRADGHVEAMGVQAWLVWEGLRTFLSRLGGDLDDILRERYYQKDKRFFPELEKARILCQPQAPAPSVGIGVKQASPDADTWLVLDAICIDRRHWPYEKYRETLSFSADLAALPTYSTAAKGGPFIFSSGQIAIDTSRPGIPSIQGYSDVPPEGRFLMAGRSHTDFRTEAIAAQTWFVYNRRKKQLESVGLKNRHIVNLDIYLSDLRDFHTFADVHKHFFPDSAPSVTVLEFPEVGHKNTRIETQLIAVADPEVVTQQVPSEKPNGAVPRWNRSAAVVAEPFVFIAGQVGIDDTENRVFETVSDLPPSLRTAASAIVRATGRRAAAVQSMAIMDRIRVLLNEIGMDLSRIVKIDVYMESFADFTAFDAVLATCFGLYRPAITCVVISGVSTMPNACICAAAVALTGDHAIETHGPDGGEYGI